MNEGPQELIGIGDLADVLGVSPSRIRQLERNRTIPAGLRVGQRRIWRASDLDIIVKSVEERRAARRREGEPLPAA